MRSSYWPILLVATTVTSGLRGAELAWRGLADPVTEGCWVRPPAEEKAAKPVWGLAEGLRIGLAPLPGPRGLLRVYTPYIGQPDFGAIGFAPHKRFGLERLARTPDGAAIVDNLLAHETPDGEEVEDIMRQWLR
jgi:hypothetical protein